MDDVFVQIIPGNSGAVTNANNGVGVTARTLSGWTSIDITRSAERVPNQFNLGMTETYPGQYSKLVVQAGDKITVCIGDNFDVVLTGYVDDVSRTISSGIHGINLTGRGKCCDLVDCSVAPAPDGSWSGSQISGLNALDVAQTLCKAYGIKIAASIDTGAPIPQKSIGYDETPFDVIEQICRYRGLLVYEKEDGSLYLTKVGDFTMASNFVETVNIQNASSTLSMASRYSQYNGYAQSIDIMGDLPGVPPEYTVKDTSIPRNRVKNLIAESVGGITSVDLLNTRLNWEKNRRNGRGRTTIITTDSWRDSAGNLWKPNALVDVQAPSLKVDSIADGKPWVISEVVFSRSEGPGTTARLTIMPQDGLSPEPKLWIAFPMDVPPVAPQR